MWLTFLVQFYNFFYKSRLVCALRRQSADVSIIIYLKIEGRRLTSLEKKQKKGREGA